MSQDQSPSRYPLVGVRNVEEGQPPIMVPAGMLAPHRGRRTAIKDDLPGHIGLAIKQPLDKGTSSPGSITFEFWAASRHRQDDLTFRVGGEGCGAGYFIPWVASGRKRQGRDVLQLIVLELPNGGGFRVWTRSKRHIWSSMFWRLPSSTEVEHGDPLAFLVRHLGDMGAASWLAHPYPKSKPRVKPMYRASLEHPAVKEWHRLTALQNPIKQEP